MVGRAGAEGVGLGGAPPGRCRPVRKRKNAHPEAAVPDGRHFLASGGASELMEAPLKEVPKHAIALDPRRTEETGCAYGRMSRDPKDK